MPGSEEQLKNKEKEDKRESHLSEGNVLITTHFTAALNWDCSFCTVCKVDEVTCLIYQKVHPSLSSLASVCCQLWVLGKKRFVH